MKKILGLFFLLGLIGLFNTGFSAVRMEGDLYFLTSLENDALDIVSPIKVTNGTGQWVGKNSSVYIGIYPILNSDTVEGRVNLFVSTTDWREVFFGGAYVAAQTTEGNFRAKVFTLYPGFSLSDPMGSGRRFSSSVYTTPITAMTRFTDGSSYYPAVFDETWIDTNKVDYSLGGANAYGGFTAADFINGAITLEDYVLWNQNDFDAFGALLKMNPLSLGSLVLELGATAEALKYKNSQDFDEYYGYYMNNLNMLMPRQTYLDEDSYVAYGGYFKLGLMDMIDIFGQVKAGSLMAQTTDTDDSNAINTIEVFSGVMVDLMGLAKLELDFSLLNGKPNEVAISNGDSLTLPITADSKRNGMEIKFKAFSHIDLDMFGMIMKYLVEATYTSYEDTMTELDQFESISWNSNTTKYTGIDVKGSLDFDFFYMFGLRELLRFNKSTFSGHGQIDVSQFESRTYLDVDLEDLTPGLWTTIGIRLNSYTITSSVNTLNGNNVSYVAPYGEIKYIFGDDSSSFARLTYGYNDMFTQMFEAYGLGYDQKMLNSGSFAMDSVDGLYNKANLLLQKEHVINLEVGIQI